MSARISDKIPASLYLSLSLSLSPSFLPKIYFVVSVMYNMSLYLVKGDFLELDLVVIHCIIRCII